MTVTSHHTNACFDAWIHCEALLVSLAGPSASRSKKLTTAVDECALSCMSTFHALKTGAANLKRLALGCAGICEACAVLCETQQEGYFRSCAKICRSCADTMTALAAASLL